MKAFKAILKIVTYIAGALAFIAGVNWLFSFLEERAHHKMPEGGKYYDWKHGRVFYHKRGHGTPLILLHGFDPQMSGKDLDSLSGHLASSHTVYRIDLPGFGLSEKPWINYTNFLYVLLIQNFIKDVTGDITDIIACGGSGLCALQAYRNDPDHIGKIVLVDPCYSEDIKVPKWLAPKLKSLIDLPVIGTFIYNIYSLKGAAPFDKEGRHVFTSRLAGYLTSDLSGHKNLIGSNVAVLKKEGADGSFTFGDVKTSLI